MPCAIHRESQHSQQHQPQQPQRIARGLVAPGHALGLGVERFQVGRQVHVAPLNSDALIVSLYPSPSISIKRAFSIAFSSVFVNGGSCISNRNNGPCFLGKCSSSNSLRNSFIFMFFPYGCVCRVFHSASAAIRAAASHSSFVPSPSVCL